MKNYNTLKLMLITLFLAIGLSESIAGTHHTEKRPIDKVSFDCPQLTIVDSNNKPCYDMCNGYISVDEVTNGVPPYTYLWSNGETTQWIENLCEGSYSVTVTDANDCTVDKDYSLVGYSQIIPNASATDETCPSCNDGTATTNPTGGESGYWYEWSNGEFVQTIVNLAPGDYTVTVGDQVECSETQTVTVAAFECPDLTIVDTYIEPCFGVCNGIISIDDVTNGEAPFSYAWSNGETTSSISDLCADSYTVIVTDANSCTVEKTYNLSELPQIVPNAEASDESCNGCNNGSATANPTGGNPDYWYEWSNGETTQTITGLAPGDYTVTVGDLNECTSEETVTVAAFECPTLTIVNFQQDPCFGTCTGYLSVESVTNGEMPYTYEWSNGATTSSIDNLCTGDYSVTVTDANNCVVDKDFIVDELPQIVPNAEASDESCNGCNNGSATANPTGGNPDYWYEWSNGETTQTITGLAPGDYTVTVGDLNECTSEETVTVNQFGCPDLSIESTKTDDSCFGSSDGEITITNVVNGVPPFVYAWSNGQTSQTAVNLVAGAYTVTVTDANNCSVISNTITITQPDAISPNVTSNNESCSGCNDGSAAANPSGGTGTYTYLWNTGATSQSIANLEPGEYTVTVYDENECFAEQTITVVAFDCPSLTLVDSKINTCFGICSGNIQVLEVTNGVEPYTYLWSNEATTSGISDLCSGEYSVTVTDANNCTVTKSYTINEFSQIVPNAGSTSETCNGCNDGTATANPTGGTPPYWYTWSNNATTQSITGLAPGNYTVTVGDVNECSSTQTVSVGKYGCEEMVFDDSLQNISCYGNCDGIISIDGISNSSGNVTYLWSTGSNENGISQLCAGSYSVTVTDNETNCITIKTYVVVQPQLLDESVTKTDESCLGCNDGTATASPTGGTAPYQYLWSNGMTTAGINNLSPGQYDVVITDINGCSIADTIAIEKFICPDLVIEDTIKNASCFGECDGVINIMGVTNSTGSISYSWSNGSTLNELENLCEGSYVVTITDKISKCTVIKSYNITQAQEIVIIVDSIVNPNGNAGGTIILHTNDNSHTYSWTGPDGFNSNSKDIDELKKGCYTLVVTDELGCTKDTTICLESTGIYAIDTNAQHIKIYPNPVRGILYFDFSKTTINAGEIILTNISGIRLKRKLFLSQKMELDISMLQNGVYIVMIKSNNNTSFRKIVVSN